MIATDPYFTQASPRQSITVSYGTQSVSAGGPYTIQAGKSLTLIATADGSPTSFNWDLTGLNNAFTTQATGPVTSSSGGVATGLLTLGWPQLQALGIDEGPIGGGPTYPDVTVEAVYGNANPPVTATSNTTTLTINPTPPTATLVATGTTPTPTPTLGGTGTVSFTDAFDWSATQTKAGFTYSYDFYDNGTFEIAGVTAASEPIPPALLAQPGSFVLHGRITAADGTYTDVYTTVTVADNTSVAPVVTVEPDQTINPGTPFSLSGVGFSDPGYALPTSPWGFTATIDGATARPRTGSRP